MVMKLLSLPCGTHPSDTITSLCVFVCGTHPSAPFTALLDSEPHRLVVGSNLHRCSTRDVVALLLLLVPLAVDALEEATEAVVGSGMTSSSMMDAMGTSDGRQILGENFTKMFGIRVGTGEVSIGRCSFRLGAPSN
jgi:hypothetical protein